jgi:uncharacterized protein DUF326
MAHQESTACIAACNACADACDHCSIACLGEAEPRRLGRCIALDVDCAQLCRLTAAAMSRGSEFAGAICGFCAQICEACGAECAKHAHDHCQMCAEACRRCAEACSIASAQAPAPVEMTGA